MCVQNEYSYTYISRETKIKRKEKKMKYIKRKETTNKKELTELWVIIHHTTIHAFIYTSLSALLLCSVKQQLQQQTTVKINSKIKENFFFNLFAPFLFPTLSSCPPGCQFGLSTYSCCTLALAFTHSASEHLMYVCTCTLIYRRRIALYVNVKINTANHILAAAAYRDQTAVADVVNELMALLNDEINLKEEEVCWCHSNGFLNVYLWVESRNCNTWYVWTSLSIPAKCEMTSSNSNGIRSSR